MYGDHTKWCIYQQKYEQVYLKRLTGFIVGCCCLLLSCFASLAQQQVVPDLAARFRHFTTEDGLPQNTAYCLHQCSQGFLWIGSEEGLTRFDGYQFKVYKPQQMPQGYRGSNWVRRIVEDTGGNLWIGTQNGLYRFDPRMETFQGFHYPEILGRPEQDLVINDLALDKKGGYLLARVRSLHTNGLLRIYLADLSAQIMHIPELNNVGAFSTPGLIVIEGKAYFSVGKKLLEIAVQNLQLLETYVPQTPKDINFSDLFALDDQTLWLYGNRMGILTFNLQQKTFDSLHTGCAALDSSTITNMIPNTLKAHSYWVSTLEKGLYRLTLQKDGSMEVVTYRHRDGGSSLGNDFVLSLHQGRDGLLWAGTAVSLDLFDPRQEVFKRIDSRSLPNMGNHTVFSITTDSLQNLWVGTDRGLYFVQKYAHAKGLPQNMPLSQLFRRAQKVQGLEGASVRSLYLEHDGSLWAGCTSGRLVHLSAKGQVLNDYALRPDPMGNGINSIIRINPQELMLAQDNKLAIFNSETGRYRSLEEQLVVQMGSEYQSNFFHPLNLFTDPEGFIWVATFFSGPLLYWPEEGRFDTLRTQNAQAVPLPQRLTSVFVQNDPEQTVWLSAFGNGIYRYKRKDRTLELFSEKDGLGNNSAYCALVDLEGQVWISTNNGICCFAPKTGQFKTYRNKDGLLTNEYNKIAFHLSEMGNLYFGSDKGLVAFDPKQLGVPSALPPVKFTDLQINYEPVKPQPKQRNGLTQSISFTKQLNLYPGERVVTIGFSSLAFANPEGIGYAYKLEGFDEDWILTDAQHRRATYSSLPAGKYQFLVKTVREQGQQQQPVALELIVHPPFWQTPWFIVLTTALLLTALVSVVWQVSQVRLKRRIREMETQHKIQLERERIARDLHDNIGSKLAYIIYNLDQVTEELAKKRPILAAEGSKENSQLQQLNEFARDTIAQLRHTIWAINKKNVRIEEFESRLQQFLWKHLGNQIAPEFTFDSQLAERSIELSPIQALNLFRMAQEAVSNILKHSEASYVWVELAIKEGLQLHLKVTDNGKGFEEAKQKGKEHYGLKNMGIRAAEIGAQLNIDGRPGKGASIHVKLPLEPYN